MSPNCGGSTPARKTNSSTAARAGDIVGVIGLRDSITGDTLCDTREPILLASIDFPETVISMAIEAESTEDRKKLAETLTMLRKQDPTFRAEENPETGQTLISGMGELHLEVVQHKLLRDYRLNVKVHKPRVSYRETIAKTAEAVGECSRMIQGVNHAAKVRLHVEPFEKGVGPVTVSNAPQHGLPNEMLSVVLEELENAGQGGGLLGFPLMRLKVTVLGGEVGEAGISEIAFRTAANHAFDQAPARRWTCAARTDYEAGSQHAGRARRRLGERPATTPRNHSQHRISRHGHSAARRSSARQPVRLLQRDALAQPRPGKLLDGTKHVRTGT